MKKIKLLLLAACMAFSMSNASAATTLPWGPDGYAFTSTPGAGAFTDTFSFAPPASTNSVFAWALSLGPTDSIFNVDFSSITLNGHAFALNNTPTYSFGSLSAPIILSGPLTLVVTGTSGFAGGYGGLLSAVAVVPEVETYAMMLAGLIFVGFMVRRRKAAPAPLAFA
jgi:hypothetical protein